MTSIGSNTSVSNTNSSSSPTVHARTPSISGQSPSAAVPANAPATRALSYANVVTTKKPPTGPGAASSSNAASQTAGGVSGQHARTASTTSSSVNGKISPAVPSFSNGGNAVINGASSTPSYSGGQHSRKSSIAAAMPNGAARGAPLIKFGDALSETGTGSQSSGTAAAAGSNLTAPLASNPRSSSPSPAAVTQPAASGGAPPATNTARPIQFGDNPVQQRPVSMPPQPHPPQGPGSMAGRGHNRHDSTQSAHTDTAATVPHGRGMPPRRGGHQGFNPGYQGQQYNYGRGNYQGGTNQPRGGPATMAGPPQFPQQYPGSPRAMPRSPALAHVPTAHHSPSMSQAVPATPTPQLYPPQAQPFMPGSPNVHYQVPPQMYQDPGYYPQAFPMGYGQYAQTSPRPQYSQPVAPQMGYSPFGQAQPMSRSSSSNVTEIHPRPPSGIGHHPPPSMTPQPQTMVHPPQVGTPGPPPQSPYRPPKKPSTKAIEIRDPNTGAAVKIATPTSAPVIVSSPSPAPGRDSSRAEAPHSRSTSRSNKTDEEKRREMREKIQLKAKKAEEERGKEKAAEEQKKKEAEAEAEAERLRKEKDEKREADEKAKEAEDKAKREAEEKALKDAAEKKAADEKLRKEAEEKAQREAEEKAKKEAEEAEAKAKAEAETKAKAAEVEAKVLEAKEKSEVIVDAEKPESPAAPVVTPSLATPDTETMPPPQKPLEKPVDKPAEKPKPKPSPLNLQIRTNEPGPPSAALQSLRSARPVENLKHLQYPEGIQSPNPALNPLANTTKFKYDKEFLMQFQSVFTEKPSVDWDQRMRDTVGDTDSARPGTARTPSGMSSRSTSARGPAMPPMGSGGAMGSFVSGSFPKPSGLTSMERFQNSSKSSGSPMPLMGGLGMGRPSSGIVRANSSTSLSGSVANAAPQSPRTGNRSARGNSKRGAGGATMERSDSRQGPQPTIPLADVKPLPVSANRWTPRSLKASAAEPAPTAAGPSGQELMSPEMVQRKVKAALNKMTPEKFDKISDQILEITAQSKYETDGRTLRQVIQLTFEKACDESHWASMYAKFCKRMLETMDPNIKDENITDKNGNVVTGGNLFRKYLLNRCQEEFERGWKVNLPKPPEGVSEEVMMLSDEYYIAAAAKRRGLGLVQFIGELFKLGMLTERIMNECVRKLLDFEGVPEDETVESLSKLLRTIGHQLDHSEKSKSMMEAYFKRIAVMIDHKDLNSRMRFMLMDVVDLRKKGWETKEADKGPKTIQEVREEALKAQQEKEAASRANRGNRPQGARGDGRQFSGGGYGNQIGYSDSRSNTIGRDELLKLGNRTRQASSGPSAFGPTSMLGARGSGSRRGLGPNAGREDSNPSSRTATPPAPVPTSSPNPFSLLDAPHNDGNDATSNPPSNSNSPQVSNAKPVTEESK